MNRTSGWYQASDGNWYYGQNPQAYAVPPQPDGRGGWTDPVPLATVTAGAPPAAEERPRRRTLPMVLAGLGGLVLGIIIGAAAGDPETDQLRARNESLAGELAALRAAATARPPARTSAPVVTPTGAATPAAPRVFARFTGTSSQRTRAFTVPTGAEWEICYTMRGGGNNAMFLEEPPGQPSELLVNEIGPARGCTQQFSGGRFSLDVTADGPWSVDVREQR